MEPKIAKGVHGGSCYGATAKNATVKMAKAKERSQEERNGNVSTENQREGRSAQKPHVSTLVRKKVKGRLSV